jgi:host factor-I protein
LKILNLQDSFLNQVRKENLKVTFYLTNGFQFRGVVKGFDNYVIVLESEGRQNLVYKHAISTIIPEREINFMEKDTDAKENT